MKRTLGMTIAAGIFAFGAAAQEDPAQMKVKLEKMVAEAKMVSMEGAVMGPAVKGAPYSADEIRENTQMLGDGTRIHNETKTAVFRDSEGRMRRETPNEISIWDPASGTNYVLNPKNMTARKMTMNFVFTRGGAGGAAAGEKGQALSFSYSTGTRSELPVVIATGSAQSADMAKTKAEMGAKALMVQADMVGGVLQHVTAAGKATRENLGTQMMEGVNAEGVRMTTTIEQGTIGNDRPIQSTSERWYSPDLQTNILTRRSDPRTGEEVVKLTNIHRGEPSPVLFELPPGYTLLNNK